MNHTGNLTVTDPSTLFFDTGKLIGTAIVTFITTNIDDLVILMNFFTVVTMPGSALKTPHVFIGQYVGFGVILALSLAGFALAFVLPVELLGFLGFLPIFLGLKALYEIICHHDTADDLQESLPICDQPVDELRAVKPRNSTTNVDADNNTSQTPNQAQTLSRWRRLLNTLKRSFCSLQILKVASITLANGSDNIVVYSALFAQAHTWQVGVYIGLYLLLMLVLLLICYFFINFRPILNLAQKYAHYIVPFAFMGIGLYVVISSDCFPWLARAIETKSFRNG